ncbi:MAG: 4Fe-4S dicluster domain-containing protein [Clostridiales bacterium]|jgi:formate hydrogenlyase subunit 6/NADH:ubiquinone oxidoreductase subunit I|nr:4Fe-4S dicluster domain-containing protein [Eubacteriales bacterium]MDH7567547.1 4Fe-4S dicluster domain-containing protein [Clostridiales bacterium]
MLDMLGNIFKNLGSKPATRMYPFEKRTPYKNARGRVEGVAIENCIFCGICAKRCPSDAITVKKEEKSWELDPFKCIICGVCAESCPKKCISMGEEHRTSALKKEKAKYVQPPKAAGEEKAAG